MATIAMQPSMYFMDDENSNIGSSPSYHLQMEVSTEHFTYAILNAKKNEQIGLAEYVFGEVANFSSIIRELGEILQNDPLLSNWKSSASIAIVSSLSTLIPKSLYNKEKKTDYLDLNFSMDEDDSIEVDSLSNTKAKNIFSLPSAIKKRFQQHFKQITFLHFSSPLLESLALQNKRQENSLVAINVRKSDFEFIAFKKKSLRIYNSFTYQNPEEFVYFCLFVFEQLKLDSGAQKVRLTGHIHANSPLFQALEKYVPDLEFETHSAYLLGKELKSLAYHEFYSLFNQYLCVL